jgi:hypothetical protein
METVHAAPLMLATIRHNSGYQTYFFDLAHSTSPNNLRFHEHKTASLKAQTQSNPTKPSPFFTQPPNFLLFLLHPFQLLLHYHQPLPHYLLF